jgi:hypothetical protein
MKPKTEPSTASLTVIGVDVGKEIFHIVGFGVDGKVAFRKKIRRLGLKDTFEKLQPCIVGMEACLSAHFVSKVLRALGHEPRIIPAIYVKPFIKGQRTTTMMPRQSLPKPFPGATAPLDTTVCADCLGLVWGAGLDGSAYGTHSMRRTKAAETTGRRAT